MKSVPIIEYDGYPHYTNTRVEVVTTEAEVRCEIINLPSVPTSPTPLSSPDKSVGDCSKDDQKDLYFSLGGRSGEGGGKETKQL